MSTPRSARPPRHHSTKDPSARSRKPLIILLTLLFLFLIGTVLVLSNVSYYLNIPARAYITEDEVPWQASDAISQLRYDPRSAVPHRKRQEWEDAGDPENAVMGTETIPEIWDQLAEEVEDDDGMMMMIDDDAEGGEGSWGLNGKGTGGYWMRTGWNGTVQDTDDWQRLLDVPTR